MPPTLLTPGSIEGVNEIPIYYIVSWIKNHMFEFGYNSSTMNDRILIVYAETGSGKSTVMPVELFRILRNKDTPLNITYRGQKVLCTQPRVLTAIELARTVSSARSPWNPDMVVGKTVGFSTGPKKERATGLIYATAGVLRAKLNSNTDEELMNEYKFIIIDEAHERSVDSDVLLFMLYKFYKRNEGNKKLPFLLLASATFDTNKYADYFGVGHDNIIKVKGSTFYITTHWPANDASNVYDLIIKTIIDINKNKDDPDKADVLIFAPGMKEMKDIEKRIKRDIKDYILVLKLDGEAVRKETSDYTLVFESTKRLPKMNGKLPTRRVIVSTSVAETGLTINTLRYVIDMGFHKGLESYPIYNIRGLVTRPAPQSRITQRRGRCGRLFDGDFYPMYSETTYDHLDKQQLPDILTSSEEYNIVHLSFYRLLDNNFNINDLRLLDKPSQETFIGANSIATILGFINNECKLTELGIIASRFSSIPMEAAKIILSGFAYNVSITDLITIAAIMQTSNGMLFMRDYMYKKYMEMSHSKINVNIPCNAHIMESILPKYIIDTLGSSDIDSSDLYFYRYKTLICDDFIESLLAFESFNKQIMIMKNNRQVSEWCQKKCLNFGTLVSIYDIRERILDDLITNGIDILYNNEYRLIDQSIDNFIPSIVNIKKCLYEGLKHNLIHYDSEFKTYKTLQGLSVDIDNSILSTQLQNKLRSMKVLTEEIQPKYIITDRINLAIKGDNTILYTISTNYISILDGYVYPDTTFGEPSYIENDIKNIKEVESDDLFKLESYYRLNRVINNDIKLPMCSLGYTIFNNNIIKNIVEPMCNNMIK